MTVGVLSLPWCEKCRHLYPEEQAFTWWDYRGGSFHRKHGLRIDFILATEGVDAVTKDVVIDRDYRRKIDELTPGGIIAAAHSTVSTGCVSTLFWPPKAWMQ